jgi:DNA-binding HxlR family transcriptional regulator
MAKRKGYFCVEGCPVEAGLDLMGGKWKGVIMYHLIKDQTLRFGQIRKKLPDVTQRMLTKQLRELEDSGVVHRKVYPEVPPKVEYSLTELGMSLVPVVKALETWGNKFARP